MEVEQKLETGLLQGPRQRQGVWKIVALGSVAAWRVKQAQACPIKPGLLQKTGGIFNWMAIAIAQATACRDRAEQRKVGTVNTRPVRGHFLARFSKRTVRALSEYGSMKHSTLPSRTGSPSSVWSLLSLIG